MAKRTKKPSIEDRIQAAVAAALANQPKPGAVPAPTPTVDEAKAKARRDAIAAVHATSHFAKRNGAPDDVVEALRNKASELERE